jgi:hypothetical protein
VNPSQTVVLERLNASLANEAAPHRFPSVDLTTLQVYEEFR